ncbi:hypothetical protein [Saccharomonospora cyanea]|uniref:PPE family protein n=1 Tax=Saccharomonospora cyanea NA-134 TaxID=882082 RepID=H5XHG4_9PSEU|nr:hypothetical protein [Saccharomonospora cyanea]EHR61644.1 hypothetical protein SaccyDRAFT_2798 [Saccharomonospora cyanea NA-134]
MASETAAGMFGVWDGYFGLPAPPEGGVNWEAYSHEELYQMLWQDADVADVSAIAAEWAGHREALANHAEVLREQRAALLASWEGTGAEEAARRLDVLAERMEEIAELARAGERAAAQAADALAAARAAMPPPPGEVSAPMNDAMTSWAELTTVPPSSAPASQPEVSSTPVALDSEHVPATGAEILAAQDAEGEQRYQELPTRPATSTSSTSSTSGSDLGMAFGAVGRAEFSFYVGAGTTDLQKQQAVRAMQTYESSLTSSSQLLGQAQGSIQSATTMSTSSTMPSGSAGASGETGGTPSWQSLTGSGGGTTAARGLAAGSALGTFAGGAGIAAGLGAGMRIGPAGHPLATGLRVGAMTMPGGSAASAAQLAAESATARSGAMGGMMPPGAGARGTAEDEEHENQMPTIDHQLFPVEEPGSEVVIGLPPEENR